MIGRISGLLIEKQPPQIIIDCNGVGYEIEAPMTTIWALPEINQQVSLYTHLAVRDDAHLLYGFSTEGERRLFRSLLKVNGVGTKMALVIAGTIGEVPGSPVPVGAASLSTMLTLISGVSLMRAMR